MTPATLSSSEPHPDRSLENKGFQEIHQALARSFKVSVPLLVAGGPVLPAAQFLVFAGPLSS